MSLNLGVNTGSWTGNIIYSDSFEVQVFGGKKKKITYHTPLLNRLAKVPGIGSIAGFTRVVLAIIHILGHLLLECFQPRRGHTNHALKGYAELIRGFIETIPLIGNIFERAGLFESVEIRFTQVARIERRSFLIGLKNWGDFYDEPQYVYEI